MDVPEQDLVVVTGFGPFRQYVVNPSWEVAKGIKKMGLGDNIKIHILEIPVCYSKARQAIAKIWQDHPPKVAIHLGIAPGTKCIILEQTGKNCGYKDRDVCGLCPDNNCCIQGGAQFLNSIIDMRLLAKHSKGLDALYSRDAGRYLCDFVYYCSLYYGQRRAALIHVPISGNLACIERLVLHLQTIIQTMLCQLDADQHGLAIESQQY